MTSPKRRGIVTLALCGGIPEWPKGADCKSVVTDFGGSNPPSPTMISIQTCVLRNGLKYGFVAFYKRVLGRIFQAKSERQDLNPRNNRITHIGAAEKTAVFFFTQI